MTESPQEPVATVQGVAAPAFGVTHPSFGVTSPSFGVIYADPPWRLKGGVAMPYPMMATRDICALPVERLAAPDCALLLWAVPSLLPDALAVIRAWGFSYKTVAFTWVKRTPRDTGYFLGRGYWTHANAEVCLLATKGRPKRMGTDVSSLVVSPRREHSRKPDEVRERIVRVFGDVPRAELFARQKVAGWSAWGNEVEPDFVFPASCSLLRVPCSSLRHQVRRTNGRANGRTNARCHAGFHPGPT